MNTSGDQFKSIQYKHMSDMMSKNGNEEQHVVAEDVLEQTVRTVAHVLIEQCVRLVADEDRDEGKPSLHLYQQRLRRSDSDADIHDNAEDVDIRSDDKLIDDCDRNKSGADQRATQKHELAVEEETNDGMPSITAMMSGMRISSEKWGQSLSVLNANGVPKRVLKLNEINNYLKLELSSTKTELGFYCSLISERYPRFYDSTIDYFQRWRMRYNVFVENLIQSEALLHIGEIHLYFDLIPRYPQPTYINNSFYENSLPIEIAINESVVDKAIKTLDLIRFGKDILQLRFPIKGNLFHNCNAMFTKFMERHEECCEEALHVHRKSELRRRANRNNSRSRRTQRSQTFDSFSGFARVNDRINSNHRNDRNFNRSERNFGANERNETELDQNEPQMGHNVRDSVRPDRKFGRRNRSCDKSKREFDANIAMSDSNTFNKNNRNFRDKSIDKGLDSEVTFEDTQERRENDANKPFVNKGQGVKRWSRRKPMLDKKDELRSGANFPTGERYNYRSDSSDRLFQNKATNRDNSRMKDKEAHQRFSANFRGNDNNRNSQMIGDSGLGANNRFGDTYRQNNRRSAHYVPSAYDQRL